VFKIESIRSQIESLKGVKEANVFLPIKIQYNEGVIMKAIERQIKKIERNKAKHSIWAFEKLNRVFWKILNDYPSFVNYLLRN